MRTGWGLLLLTLFCLAYQDTLYAKESQISSLNFPFYESTIAEIQSKIQNESLTCYQVIEAFQERILRYDLVSHKLPPYNTVQHLNIYALEQADDLDEYFKTNQSLKGPLHCIPVLVKDNIATEDMPMTSGTYALLGNQPIKDAYVIKALRKAGAVILATTTMDELASGMFGVSSRHGRTGNAYDPLQNSGGSSAGSAVALSLNFGVLALGSDNSGSIRIPASYNGIYGLRPTRSLVSLSGVFPRGFLDGVVGPMARTPQDLALMLNVIAEADPHDRFHATRPKMPLKYTEGLEKNALQGKRIGILKNVGKWDLYRKASKPVMKKYAGFIKRLKALGAITVDNLSLEGFDGSRQDNMAGEVEAINDYLQRYPATRSNYNDICRSNRVSNWPQAKCLEHVRTNAKVNSKVYRAVENRMQRNRKLVEDFMKANRFDALLLPVSGQGVASYDIEDVNTFTAAVSSNSGLPALAVVTGYTYQGLPVGMQFIGKAFDERTLLAIAYDYDSHFNPRRSPTVDLKPIQTPLTPEHFNLFKTLLGQMSFQEFLNEKDPATFDGVTFKGVYNKAANRILHLVNGW